MKAHRLTPLFVLLALSATATAQDGEGFAPTERDGKGRVPADLQGPAPAALVNLLKGPDARHLEDGLVALGQLEEPVDLDARGINAAVSQALNDAPAGEMHRLLQGADRLRVNAGRVLIERALPLIFGDPRSEFLVEVGRIVSFLVSGGRTSDWRGLFERSLTDPSLRVPFFSDALDAVLGEAGLSDGGGERLGATQHLENLFGGDSSATGSADSSKGPSDSSEGPSDTSEGSSDHEHVHASLPALTEPKESASEVKDSKYGNYGGQLGGATGPQDAAGPDPSPAPFGSATSALLDDSDPAPAPAAPEPARRGRVVYNGIRVSDSTIRGLLQRIADHYGRTVRVTSGNRGSVPRGGSATSWHLRHRAADFHVVGIPDRSVFDTLRNLRGTLLREGTFEVIWHTANTNTSGEHMHIGNRAPGQNRFKIESGGRYRVVN